VGNHDPYSDLNCSHAVHFQGGGASPKKEKQTRAALGRVLFWRPRTLRLYSQGPAGANIAFRKLCEEGIKSKPRWLSV
jgi:hypothetical protein